MVVRWATWLLGALLVVGLMAACSDAPPETPSSPAEKFRQEVLSLLQKRVDQARPFIEKGHTSVQKWLDGLFSQASAKDNPLHYDLVVLSHKATVVAWQGPDHGFTKTDKADLGQDYSHFNKLDPVYKQHKIASFEIYSTNGNGFGVCAPVLKDEKFLACFCLGFKSKILQDKYGIDGKQFLALDFN